LFKRAAAALPARLNNSSARALMQKKTGRGANCRGAGNHTRDAVWH